MYVKVKSFRSLNDVFLELLSNSLTRLAVLFFFYIDFPGI